MMSVTLLCRCVNINKKPPNIFPPSKDHLFKVIVPSRQYTSNFDGLKLETRINHKVRRIVSSPAPASVTMSKWTFSKRTFHHLSQQPPSPKLLPLKLNQFAEGGRRNMGIKHNTDFVTWTSKTAERLRERDLMPKSYTLVYRSDFAMYLIFCQLVMISLCFGFAAFLIIEVLEEPLSEEEKEKMLAEWKEKVEEKAELASKAWDEKYGSMKLKGGFDALKVTPELKDMAEFGTLEYACVGISLVMFAIGLLRVLRIIPARVYVNDKDHCVSIKYAHLIPGKITHHEFLAGTLTPVKSFTSKWWQKGALFQDGSGGKHLLLERFFRSGADYNRLLGYDMPEDMKKDFKIHVKQVRKSPKS